MQRPLTVPIGAPPSELDTPALVVDLGAFERYLIRAHGRIAARGIRHVQAANVARMLSVERATLERSGLAVGVCSVSHSGIRRRV